jgi:glycosyltransferase involved in cell wall biosynthesis
MARAGEMKILVLCYEYPPIGGGGGRVAQSVAEQLAARGHEVRVQTAALGWRSVRETINGVEVFRTGSGRRAPDTCAVHEMGLYLATSLFPTLGQIRRWRPDVIHAHFAVPTGLLAWAAHLVTQTPYVLTAHLGDVPGGVPEQTDRLFRLVGPMARQVWRRAAAATAVSSFVQGLAQHAYERPVTRILNGVDLHGAEPPPEIVRSERRLVFLGRFNPQKNPDFLIRALAGAKNVKWKLTMIGDGPLMPQVRAEIARHGLEDRVQCAGWLAADEVHRILRESDILCLPSTSEGMPVAAIEALRGGLAIVASNIPGVLDVVEDGVNGFLPPCGDEPAFVAKLRLLCAEDATLLAMRRASRRKAHDFELSAIVNQYETVLKAAAPNPE